MPSRKDNDMAKIDHGACQHYEWLVYGFFGTFV